MSAHSERIGRICDEMKRRIEERSRNPVIVCGCGCGVEFQKFDSHGRPRAFVNGHNTMPVKPKTRGRISGLQRREAALRGWAARKRRFSEPLEGEK